MSAMLASGLSWLVVWLLVPDGGRATRLRPAARPVLPPWLRAVPGARSLRARGALGSGLGLAVWLAAGGGGPALMGGALLAVVITVATGRLAGPGPRRRAERLVADVPQALDLLVSCLEAGLPLRAATQAVAAAWDGPVAEHLTEVSARVAVGIPEDEAWRCLADVPVLGPVARDVARSWGSGTALVPTLRRHAEDARADRAAQVQTTARAVGVSSVLPLMVCFLPAFLLVGVVPIVAGVALHLLGQA